MAIRCRLSTLMGENRYSIQAVSDRTGLSRNTVSQLYHDKMKRFDDETLSRLCELFECKIEDLIEYRRE